MPDPSAGRPLPLPEDRIEALVREYSAAAIRNYATPSDVLGFLEGNAILEGYSSNEEVAPLLMAIGAGMHRVADAIEPGSVLPPSAEHREESPPSTEVFKTWYRSKLPDGTVWCESSDPAEVVELSAGEGCLFERLVIELVTNPWEPWTPAHDGSAE